MGTPFFTSLPPQHGFTNSFLVVGLQGANIH